MESNRVRRRTLQRLALCGLMGLATAQAEAAGTPDGLSTSDWNSIRAEYERHRQAAFPVEGGHRARNFGQQWVNEFDGRGFLVTPDSGAWKWGLQLESYGWAGKRPRGAAGGGRRQSSPIWSEDVEDGARQAFTRRRRSMPRMCLRRSAH